MRLLLLCALLAGCRCQSDESQPAPNPEPNPALAISWKTATVGNLRLSLPEPFTREVLRNGDNTLFLAPESGGHKPTVLVYWIKSSRTIEQWAEFNRLKWDDSRSGVPIHDQGWTTVGGRKAYFLIREEKSAVPKLQNKVVPFLLIDWYLQYDGHVGYLRGISMQNRFAFENRPIFEQIARRVRYVK